MFFKPMLLTPCPNPVIEPDIISEPKLDGHRMILNHSSGIPKFYTRHGNELFQYPELNSVPFSDDVVVDGEVVCYKNNKIDFELLMKRFRMSDSRSINEGVKMLPVHMVVFDILFYKGNDVRNIPLVERKELLQRIFRPNNHYSLIPYTIGQGQEMFDQTKIMEIEGAVYKKPFSKYVGRRSDQWKKCVHYDYSVVRILGLRKGRFGWLIGFDDEEEGGSAGILELGVPAEARRAIYKLHSDHVIREDDNFLYIPSGIKLRVKHLGYTHNGYLRLPSFVEFVF